jgi:hypothetical protein
MWLRILGQSESYEFVGVPDVLVNYRQRADSISADRPARFDALYAMLSEYGHRLTAADRRSYSYPITLGLRNRRHREAFRLLRASLPWGPPSILVDERWRAVALYALLAAVGRPLESSVRALRRRFVTSGAPNRTSLPWLGQPPSCPLCGARPGPARFASRSGLRVRVTPEQDRAERRKPGSARVAHRSRLSPADGNQEAIEASGRR